MALDLDQSDLERPLAQRFEQLFNIIKVYDVFGFWVVIQFFSFCSISRRVRLSTNTSSGAM